MIKKIAWIFIQETFHQCLLLGGSHMEWPKQAVSQGSKLGHKPAIALLFTFPLLEL